MSRAGSQPADCGVAVQVRDLVKTYPSGQHDEKATRGIRGVSLDVQAATVHAILGPNGAGKTTLVEICEGFRDADSGTVSVLGLHPRHQHDALTPRIGVMLQDGIGAYTGARTRELLSLFAAYAAHPYDVDALLDRVGLTSVAQTAVKRLSGGQAQRLSLAMALIARPELVFLDEPTAGMDPHARRETWALIQQLRSDGVTVVLTTHFLDEAEHLADYVTVIASGHVVAAGTPAELTKAGAAGQVRFNADAGLAISQLESLLPAGSVVTEPSAGSYLVTAAVDPQLLATLTAWCAEQGVFADDLRVQRRTLEDVFLELTADESRT